MDQMITDEVISIASSADAMQRDELERRVVELETQLFVRPFIVLTETKFSKRHIPVWARYSPLRTRVEAHANTLSP